MKAHQKMAKKWLKMNLNLTQLIRKRKDAPLTTLLIVPYLKENFRKRFEAFGLILPYLKNSWFFQRFLVL